MTYDEVVGEATVFVSFAYSMQFSHLISALEVAINTNGEIFHESTYFWFDMLVNDQWHALEHDFDWWSNTFSSAISDIGQTLCIFAPWDAPICLQRVWCLYELKSSKNISIALSAHEVDSFQERLRYDTSSIMKAVSGIYLENAESYMKEDKDRIFEVIERTCGFHDFNAYIIQLLRTWIFDESMKLATKVAKVETYRRLTASEKITTSETLMDLQAAASVILDQGRYEEAKKMYERALDGFSALFNPDHPSTTQCKIDLSVCLSKLGDFEEALSLCQAAIDAYNAMLGPDSIVTLRTIGTRASIYSAKEDLNEAKKDYEHVIHGLEMYPNEEQLKIVITSGLANVLRDLDDLSTALKNYEWVLAREVQMHGPRHPSTLTTMSNMAILQQDIGEFELAQKLYVVVLEGREETLGVDNLDTLIVLNNYAGLLDEMGDFEKAVPMYERALAGKLKLLGPDNPSTNITLENLKACKEQMLEIPKTPTGSLQRRKSMKDMDKDKLIRINSALKISDGSVQCS